MDQHGLEGLLLHLLHAGENHAGHPEEDDVIPGDQHGGGVPILQVLGVLVGPAQGGEGPQSGAEPGVQHVLLPGQMGAAALFAAGGVLPADVDVAAVVAGPGGDLVAPPQLAADAPVAAAAHPVQVVLGKAVRHKLDLALFHALNGGLGQGFHLDEPLLRHHGFNHGMAAVAGADLKLQRLDHFQVAGFQGIGGSLIISAGHVAVIGQHADDGQVMALADLKVVGVMGGGDLHNAGAFFHIGVLIAHDGNLFVQQRQNDMAAVQVGIARVLAVDGNGGIAQHGFGAGGGQFQHLTGLLDRVQQVPETAVLLLVFHFGVRDGSVAVGAPVHHAVAAVDQALIIQAHKHFFYGVGAALVHGKALTLPVAGAAQLFQLADNAAAISVPCPGALQKAIAAQHFFGQALLAHGGNHLGFGGNGSMVGARHPQSGIALHTLVAGQDILPSFVHGVAHVQLAGNIRRRHYDGERLFAAVDLGVEIALIAPFLVNSILCAFGIILLGEFFCHDGPP